MKSYEKYKKIMFEPKDFFEKISKYVNYAQSNWFVSKVSMIVFIESIFFGTLFSIDSSGQKYLGPGAILKHIIHIAGGAI